MLTILLRTLFITLPAGVTRGALGTRPRGAL